MNRMKDLISRQDAIDADELLQTVSIYKGDKNERDKRKNFE